MAPEQVRGYTVDHRSDIFAFGTILYELLSGRRAFKKDTPADTMAAILNEIPPDAFGVGAEHPAGHRPDRPALHREGAAGAFPDRPRGRHGPGAGGLPGGREHRAFPAVRARPSARRPRLRSGRLRRPRPGAAPPRPSAARSRCSSAAVRCSNPRPTSNASTSMTRRACSEVFARRATARRARSRERRFSATSRGSCSASGTRWPTRTAPGERRTRPWRFSGRWSPSPPSSATRTGWSWERGWACTRVPRSWAGDRASMSLVGEARNVAVGLKEHAAPGQIVCSAATHRLIRSRFDCASVGEHRIRGLAEPVEIFRVQGIGEVRNPIETVGAAGLTPLTGRDVEMTLLKDRWERAQEGAGQIVMLIGDPGLGKSRLVYTLKQLVREQAGAGHDQRCADVPDDFRRRRPAGRRMALRPASPEHGPLSGDRVLRAVSGPGAGRDAGAPVRAAGAAPPQLRPGPERPRAPLCDAAVAGPG